MGSEKREAERPGTQTGTFLPAEIRHSSTRLSKLGDRELNAKLVGHQVQRLLGFWFVYNALGGLEPMMASGLWPRSTAYKQLAEFRDFYGCTPDELEPDLVAALAAAASEWPDKYKDGVRSVVERQRARN